MTSNLSDKLKPYKNESRLPLSAPAIHELLHEATTNNVVSVSYSLSFLGRFVCYENKAPPPRLFVVIFLCEEIKKLYGRVLLWILFTVPQPVNPFSL